MDTRNDSQHYFELVHLYVTGNLDENQVVEFEKELSTNTWLQKEVELEMDINEALKDREIIQLRRQLNVISSDYKLKKRFFGTKKWMYIAASFIILFGAFQILKPLIVPLSENELFTVYYSPSSYEVTNRGENNAEMNTEALKMAKANELMLQNNFEGAMNIFQQINTNTSSLYYDQATWYLGLCYLELDKKQEAIAIFKQIHENKDNVFGKKVQKNAGEILKNLSFFDWLF